LFYLVAAAVRAGGLFYDWKYQNLVRQNSKLTRSTGAYGSLPVMKEVKLEAERRQVELVIVATSEAIRLIEKGSAANAILHVTC
jgi:hypothetical protein